MVSLRVRASTIKGEVTAPPSKSYTHRAFAIGLLARNKSEVINPLIAFDTQATIDALRILGGETIRSDGAWSVFGTGGRIRLRADSIDVRNSGTTLRFMSAIASLSGKPVLLTGDESVLARPMGPLIKALQQLGAKARCMGPRSRAPVIVGGGLEGGEAEITGRVSSQFISALLLASPYAKEDVNLFLTDEPVSKSYIEITLEMLSSIGVRIGRNPELTEFKIPGRQVFRASEFKIPGDFSSASFLLGAGALTGKGIRVKNLDVRGVQGDKRIVEFLREFGADIRIRGKTIEVHEATRLSGIEADCSDNPDLVPVLAVLGAVGEGLTKLTNIPHLRFKEVDRLRTLRVELTKLGARVEELPRELRIRGVKQLKGSRVNSYGDHRMAMALAIAGLAARGETIVDGAESIGVSYPGFIEGMRKLGAKLELMV